MSAYTASALPAYLHHHPPYTYLCHNAPYICATNVLYNYPASVFSGYHKAVSLRAQSEKEQVPRSPDDPQEPHVSN